MFQCLSLSLSPGKDRRPSTPGDDTRFAAGCGGQTEDTGRLHRLASAIKVETFLASMIRAVVCGLLSASDVCPLDPCTPSLLCVARGRVADNDGWVLLTNRHVKPEARRLDWICLFLPFCPFAFC